MEKLTRGGNKMTIKKWRSGEKKRNTQKEVEEWKSGENDEREMRKWRE